MQFDPIIPTIQVSQGGVLPASSGEQEPLSEARASIVYPISTLCDLNDLPASIGDVEFFLLHPYDGTIERIYLSAYPGFSKGDGVEIEVSVVQKQAEQVVAQSQPLWFSQLAADPPVQLEIPQTLTEGPVFLRVTGTTADYNLQVTMLLKSSEIK